jgi:ribosomal-protein-alanine N-acetyltransferase
MFAWLRRVAPMPDVRLTGDGLLLRPPRDGDYAQWAELRRVSRDFLVPWEPSWPRDALTRGCWRRRLRHYGQEWHFGASYSFMIFRLNDLALMGGITLSNVRRGVAQAGTVGYWVGAPFARQGVMTGAVGLTLRFAYEDLGLHRVEAACLPSNAASRGLLRKCGFHEEGYAPQYLKIDGAWRDHVLFAKLEPLAQSGVVRVPRSEAAGETAQAWPASPDSMEPSTPSLANARSHLVSRS